MMHTPRFAKEMIHQVEQIAAGILILIHTVYNKEHTYGYINICESRITKCLSRRNWMDKKISTFIRRYVVKLSKVLGKFLINF